MDKFNPPENVLIDSRAQDAARVLEGLATAAAPVVLRVADPEQNAGRREVAFIDAGLEAYQSLVNAIGLGVEVVLLDAAQDGLAQMALWAQSHSGYDAIHILSHGSSGVLYLGNASLTNANVGEHTAEMTAIGRSLTDQGDILVYGCHVAEGAVGADFLGKLVQATGADISASEDATGSAMFGGDWVLETQIGVVNSDNALAKASLDSYGGLLAVSDQNFDAGGRNIWTNTTSQTVGTWTFSGIGGTVMDLAVIDANDLGVAQLADNGSDLSFLWNANVSSVTNTGSFSFRSTDGTNFDLNSFSLGSLDGGSMSVTVSGRRDNIEVVSGEVVNLTSSDSAGNITYALGATTFDGSYGVLTFGTAFDNVDEIRLVFSATSMVEIDDIDISAAVTDTTAPTVNSVNSSTANGTYKVGDIISVQVNFSEAVTVTGTPQLTLETGSTDRVVNYVSGSGTSTLTYTYTVQAGDTNADLDYQSSTALALNGGTIRDAAGNNATLTLASPGAANSLGANKAIVIDGVAPTVSSVNSSTVNGTYKVGDIISVQVNFSEAVTVTGTPQLTLETGGTDRVVNYVSGSGTSTLSYTYTVQAGDTNADLDYISTSALALNGGTIRDAAGNNATLTLASPGAANSLGANKAIVIDGLAPTISSVNSSTANGTYKVGDIIWVQVNFSEAVTVTGTPQLTLETGSTDRVANYASGSGTSTLTFSYTVQAGDTNADLDYISTSALALNGGSIRDAAGNNATLTLASPGAANSLSSNKAMIIDTTSPAAPSTPDMTSGTDSGASSSDNITNDTTPTFTGTAESGSTVTLYDTDGTTVLGTGTATGGNWSITSSTLSAGSHTLTAKAADAAGNVSFASAGLSLTIDTSAPTAAIVVPDNLLTIGETSLVTFTFSEPVVDFTTADLTAPNATLSGLSSGDGGITWTATLTPSASTTDSSNVIALDFTGITDISGNAGTSTATSGNYATDTVRPTLASAIAISDTALRVGDTATVTFTFNEAVTGFTIADLLAPNGVLSSLSSSDGGITWTATLTPSANTTDSSNVITLAYNGITDAAGNVGTSTASSGNYVVDTQAPIFVSGLVNGRQLVLSYAEANALSTVNPSRVGAFQVRVGNTLNQLSLLAVDATSRTVTLDLNDAIRAGQLVTVAYSAPAADNDADAIRDAAGNFAASFAATPVSNLTPVASASLEDRVPGLSGPNGAVPTTGDGNGDGFQDGTQSAVASLTFQFGDDETFLTWVADSVNGKVMLNTEPIITSLWQAELAANPPLGANMPLGLMSSTVSLAPGVNQESFSLYLSPELEVNGFWSQDISGVWTNLASHVFGGDTVLEGGKRRLDLLVTDGGLFDKDLAVDGVITVLGAPGYMPLSASSYVPDLPPGPFFF